MPICEKQRFTIPKKILSMIMCLQNLVLIGLFVFKILSKNSILKSIKGSNSQGGHKLWKTGKSGKMVKKNSPQGKIREFRKKLKIREKSGNLYFKCFHLPQNNHFHSYADLATGVFFLLFWFNLITVVFSFILY